MVEQKTLVYLQAGPVTETVPAELLLRLEPGCHQRLGPLRYDSHYHVSFFEADGAVLAPFCNFVLELDQGCKKFTLSKEDRVSLLSFLRREKFSLLEEALARNGRPGLKPAPSEVAVTYSWKIESKPLTPVEQNWLATLVANFQLLQAWLCPPGCTLQL